jgi:hypothetical protein
MVSLSSKVETREIETTLRMMKHMPNQWRIETVWLKYHLKEKAVIRICKANILVITP